MAGSLNKVLLIGRLGADPEIKQMVNGKSVARLSLATSQSWKDKTTGEKKEKTEWHRIVVFNDGLVNVVQQYLKKGAQIYVEGQIVTRKWKDEQSGQDKYSTEIVIQGYNSSLTMLGGGNTGGGIQNDNNQVSNNNFEDSPQTSNDMDDEIPFQFFMPNTEIPKDKKKVDQAAKDLEAAKKGEFDEIKKKQKAKNESKELTWETLKEDLGINQEIELHESMSIADKMKIILSR